VVFGSTLQNGLKLVLIAALLNAAAALFAQQEEAEPLGILIRGPVSSRGLPFLPANSIRHYRGRYETSGGEILVRYTEEEIVPRESWERSRCGSRELRVFRVASETERAVPVAYIPGEGYHLFFRFTGGALDCSFIDVFIQRFRYFRSVPGGDSEAPPFPAIVRP